MNSARAEAKQKAIESVETLDGWLTKREAGALFDLAADANGPIVEIGSFHGRSTTALALGSMAGSGQPVTAIDSFEGVPSTDRPTNFGVKSPPPSTPELLRANLDKFGINGQVQIVAKRSHDAAAEVGSCGVLFIDGGHDYETVRKDLELYLPKVLPGGSVILHDVTDGDPGVLRAVDEMVWSNLSEWSFRGRFDTAIVASRTKTIRRKVMLGCPGASFLWGSVSGICQSSIGHHSVQSINNGNGFDDFNFLWAHALNKAESGEITHFAMLHADVCPTAGWLDVLIGEMEHYAADLVSVAIPIKNHLGVTSSGIGDPDDRWSPFRRFTMRELQGMPETFGIEDTPHPDKYLLHNTGCWVCDLRNPLFFQTDEAGDLKCFFDFPTKVERAPNGKWRARRESEDWFFSRNIADLKAKTYITRKVQLSHRGYTDFVNYDGWGSYKDGDAATRSKWDKVAE